MTRRRGSEAVDRLAVKAWKENRPMLEVRLDHLCNDRCYPDPDHAARGWHCDLVYVATEDAVLYEDLVINTITEYYAERGINIIAAEALSEEQLHDEDIPLTVRFYPLDRDTIGRHYQVRWGINVPSPNSGEEPDAN
jgi:hypothetical protein